MLIDAMPSRHVRRATSRVGFRSGIATVSIPLRTGRLTANIIEMNKFGFA